MNGPSVVSILPSCTRTVVAVWGLQLEAGAHARGLVDRPVRLVDPPSAPPPKDPPTRRRRYGGRVALMDQLHVLHVRSSLNEIVASTTNERDEGGQTSWAR